MALIVNIQNIIVFNKFMIQGQYKAVCIGCGSHFSNKNFAVIFKPYDHAIICKTCIIRLNKQKSINGCPKCCSKIYYAVLN